MKYVAFLRGINVGGNHLIKMSDLRKTFESLGYENVQTLLASGNIVFDAKGTKNSLSKKIEAGLEKRFKHPIGVVVRSQKEMSELVAADPFQTIDVTTETRLFVTFFPGRHSSSLKIPHAAPLGDFCIVRMTELDACSVLVLRAAGAIGSLAFLEKEFGKRITTRSWNTVVKVAKLLT